MLAVAAVAMFVASCKPDTPPTTETKTPTVNIELLNQEVGQAEFVVTATNATEVYFYLPEDGGEPSDSVIKSEGELVPEDGKVYIWDLTPGKKYTAYALAIGGELSARTTLSFTAMEEQPEPFEGYELNKFISAVYRNDNDALAGNYELMFGNTTDLGWEGDVQVFIDFYNEEDSDPLNPVLPNGVYEPNTDYSPFTYNPVNSYVDIVVEGGEVISTPILGIVTVDRSGATYTITVEGTLMLLGDMEFSARYTGPIQFVQGGTSAYEFFEEDVTVDFSEAQIRYWGSWFYPFCDDLGVEMFDGTFDENGSLQRGYYLHLSRVFMPKADDYNAEYIPLSAGEYFITESVLDTIYSLPYRFDMGAITDYFGDKYFTGTYLQYVENGQVKKVGLVTDGSFTVENDGKNTKIVMNFTTDNGVNLALSFDGEMAFGNFNDNDESMSPRPWTTLDVDHTYSFPEGAMGSAFCLGEIMKPGFDNWMLMIYATNDEYPDGYGDMFTTEFIVETGGSRSSFPTGTFNVSLDVEDHTMFAGIVNYAGSILFTWYGDLTPDAEGYSSETAPIAEGTVTVEDAGNGDYRFVFDLVDDGGYKVTGEWTGKVAAQDISDAMSSSSHSAPKPLALRK